VALQNRGRRRALTRGLAALNALDPRSLAIVVRITAVGRGTVWPLRGLQNRITPV
jgi:hypothetical protein